MLRWECFAEATLEQGIDDHVCAAEGWSHGGGVQVAARACNGLWLLAWHNFGWLALSSSPRLWWWCNVVLGAFVCLVFVYTSTGYVQMLPILI
jgi:hypothetical protein